ncbi:MAG: hypothetical protein K0V04_36455 [Deltaproteobacteria bacterium]|nr:hypothetical protein [Deltaproteobacteria bacterium]
MATAMRSTIPGIPPEAQALFDELHDAPAKPLADLRAELAEYTAKIAAKEPRNEMLDASVGKGLSQACSAMLDMVEAGADEATRRLVQAAVRYFVVEDDVEPDLDSLWGLDDDAAVCNAIARHLGRDDLVVAVS